jgi:hypothetical protein
VLGGDHSLSLGSIRGAARVRNIGVIWVDAHADFNTEGTTPSGNIHGMPLAALCGLGDARLTQLWEESAPVVDPQRVAIIGARDLDPGEKTNLREAGVLVMGMEQIDRIGMVAAMEKAIERVSRNADGLYLSFDMDVMDPRHAPGVGTPVAAGLTQREGHLACELVGETGKLVGMDIVEVNPILDVQNQTGAPPRDTHGRTDPTLPSVGAHTAHLAAGLDCGACHVKPLRPDDGHIDGLARIVWGPLAGYFAAHAGSLALQPQEVISLKAGKLPIAFLEYDWALNDAK